MSFVIKWTPLADETFDETIEFIKTHWNEDIINRFVQDTFSTIDLIKENPKLYKTVTGFENVRKGSVNEFISLFYRINQNNIELLYFWDNRKNPNTSLLKE